MGPDFELDPRLAADSLAVGDLTLCQLRLMDDRRFPWLLLVPRRPGLRELFELPAFDQAQLLIELNHAARALQAWVQPHKLNLGALGNIVPQLHLHLIARFENDPAWPGPVWGSGARQPYDEAEAKVRVEAVRAAFVATHEAARG
jgi:diadenosine tetraphosphate (Ap4A) HIT family hydrolase